MEESRNQHQIIRKDNKNCFVESLSDAFEIGKAHLAFATYDLNKPAGNRQTNCVHIYISIGFVTIRFVVGERKIAAVDGNTHEAILHLPLPKVFTQHLLFLLRVHQRIDIGRRIRNSPAETIHPLICNLRVQIDQLIFPASVIAKWDRLFLGNSFFSFVCG